MSTSTSTAYDPRFRRLRGRHRGFAFPMTVAFLAWYLLYVVLSAYARDFMATRVAGHVNLALVLGLGQFVSTFLIAAAYARYAQRRLDPLADELRAELDTRTGHGYGGSAVSGGQAGWAAPEVGGR